MTTYLTGDQTVERSLDGQLGLSIRTGDLSIAESELAGVVDVGLVELGQEEQLESLRV